MKQPIRKLALTLLLLSTVTQPVKSAQQGVIAAASDGFFIRSDSSLGVLSDIKATWSIDGVAAVAGSNLLVGADDSLYLMNLKVTPPEISLVATNVVAAAAGSGHRLWLRSDGTLWALGSNAYGQLGDGTQTERSTPVQIATEVIAIAAGSEHSMFIKANGTLWAMGRNNYGQLGDGSTADRTSAVQVATDATAVAAAGWHSLFLKHDSTLWGMGFNAFGQLGDGTFVNTRSRPQQVGTDVVAVAAGDSHSLFITADGGLYGMGKNMYGEVGAGLYLGSGYIYSPKRVASDVVAAVGGLIHSLFVKSDGSLWLMGHNYYGPTSGDVFLPEQLVPPGPVSAPLAPAGLSATDGALPAEVRVTWERALGATRYEVWRNTANSPNTATRLVANISISFYDDLSALGGTTYYYWIKAANAGGTSGFSNSDSGYCTKGVGGTAPSIAKHPESQNATAGEAVTFTVLATGTVPLNYQWSLNGNNIPGATSNRFSLTGAQAAEAGAYRVTVSNAAGSVTSDPATLTVKAAAPTILGQSNSLTVTAGTNVTLAVTATGTAPLSYQWRVDGADIPGAITASLALNNVQGKDNGVYEVRVSNPIGSTVSSSIVLVVLGEPGSSETPSFRFVTTAGGSGYDSGRGLAADDFGHIYVAGVFTGTATISGTSLTSNGDKDIFVAQYDNAGKLLWIRKAGGVGVDEAASVAVDPSGNCYVTGRFAGTAAFGAIMLEAAYSDDFDLFVAKFDSGGNVLWAKRAGGIDDDLANAIAVDKQGNAYVTGSFRGTAFQGGAKFGGTTLITQGLADIFVVKFSSGGDLLWVRQAGGAQGDDVGVSIAVDGAGNSYVTGYFQSVASFGAINLNSTEGRNLFVAKYDSAGNAIWAKGIAGTVRRTVFDIALDGGIALDGTGNCYVAGEFSGTLGLDTAQLVARGSTDVFLAKYDSQGNVRWSRQAGGLGDDYVYGLAVDSRGNCYVSGAFAGVATFSNVSVTSLGGQDVFVAAYDRDGGVRWVKQAGGTAHDYGNAITVDVAGTIFLAGDFFGTNRFDAFSVSSAGSADFFVSSLAGGGEVASLPRILSQPQSRTATVGADVRLSIVLAGNGTVQYQWRLNGAPIPAATNSTLMLASIQIAQAGRYDVVVGNSVGDVTSEAAVITVIDPKKFWMESLPVATNGQVRFRVHTPVNGAIVLLTSTNLVQWTPLRTNVATQAPSYFEYYLTPGTVQRSRFYRAAQ